MSTLSDQTQLYLVVTRYVHKVGRNTCLSTGKHLASAAWYAHDSSFHNMDACRNLLMILTVRLTANDTRCDKSPRGLCL